ncbi:rod shape-determining protein MreB [Longimicrobium terrae]|uniref:Cell shape-determining protein MreB n=1 Tax=Longimicrobium terrae TaxID=1639882 RepID=A0A841H3E8_9BACT|nr:rod shape-determining protein MreB [Longimicrobium terrae]MBB6072530.1 rod shape-determining protein MreB [Longimicrobium terrae]NNC28689.1 rod shape-determining protein [Longimicrobium terrae]
MADIAIDLGTANTLIEVKGEGLVVNEPSVVAVDRETRKVRAIGLEAKRMLGRTPEGILAVRPMRDGVIADVDMADLMLRHFLERVLPRGFFRVKPRVVIGVPSGITEMEKRAVRAAVMSAGARSVYLISEPMAAAIGVGLPVTSPRGSMVVNVGGGTSEIGVVALSGIVADASIRVAGYEMDEAIVGYVRKSRNLLIGEATAEGVKIQVGSAYPLEEEREMDVTGRDLVNGIPKTVRVNSIEIRECIAEPVAAIVSAVRRALEVTPPELASDILDAGIVMTGGGAQLRGLGRLLERETGLSIHLDEQPLTCVVRGAARVLEDWDLYQGVLSH